ncbi:MAG: hypothetical protein HY820_02660 [Acidobacteria bacterium]|nr:hypothetical protein [Acidobacteriota bacterium]
MADETAQNNSKSNPEADRKRGVDEVALELMKFVALTTGYGKPSSSSTGFTGKAKSGTEEYADSLLQLFERCREIVKKD